MLLKSALIAAALAALMAGQAEIAQQAVDALGTVQAQQQQALARIAGRRVEAQRHEVLAAQALARTEAERRAANAAIAAIKY